MRKQKEMLSGSLILGSSRTKNEYLRMRHLSNDGVIEQNILAMSQSTSCTDTGMEIEISVQPKIFQQYEKNLEKNRKKIEEIKQLIHQSKKTNSTIVNTQNKRVVDKFITVQPLKVIRNLSIHSPKLETSTTHSCVRMSQDVKSQLYRFKKIKYLGRGHISDVYSVIDCVTGVVGALKIIQKSVIKSKGIEKLIKTEIAIQSMINHPNILKCYGVFYDSKQIALFLELGENTLFNLIKEKKMQEKQVIEILYQVFKAVNHLHIQGIMHRDIKPENILLQADVVKLADLGICIKAQSSTQYCGTQGYMAPEIKSKYDNKIDCYSIGILLQEMLKGIQSSIELNNIMNSLLQENPEIRISCKQGLQSTLFQCYEKEIIHQNEKLKNTIFN